MFADVLDNTFKFIDAYLDEFPGEWLHMLIAKDARDVIKYSSDYWRYEENIEIKVLVGIWYDNILYKNKDIEDYMMSAYEFNPSENAFVYKIQIAESTNCIIPRGILEKQLFDYLDAYEKSNPNRRLTRTSFGIHHHWNCKFEIGGVIMEKKFVEVTLNEKVIENHSCSNGCQRAQGSSTGG